MVGRFSVSKNRLPVVAACSVFIEKIVLLKLACLFFGQNQKLLHYIEASCTFCVSSITFSLNKLSVSIKSFTVWQL